jgi:hypothetical protein
MIYAACRMVLVVVAFFIGLAGLHAAQHAWLTAMTHRMDDVRKAGPSYLPPSQPVTADFSKMQQFLDQQPKIDFRAAQQAGFQGQFQQMQLRNTAAEMGAPQIANGIPTMPGQGVPLQYYHPPGVPFH